LAEKGGTVTLKVREGHVDGLTRVLGWAALGAPPSQRGGQLLDALLDVLQIGEILWGGVWRREDGVGLGPQA